MTLTNKKEFNTLLENPYIRACMYIIQVLIVIVGFFLVRTLNEISTNVQNNNNKILQLETKTEILTIKYNYLDLQNKELVTKIDDNQTKVLKQLKNLEDKFDLYIKESNENTKRFFETYELKRK